MAETKKVIGSNKCVLLSAVILLLTATILIYWSGLGGPLVLDDTAVLGRFLDERFSALDFSHYLIDPSGPLGRPVAMLSFAANAFFSIDTFYWKLINLALHLATGVVVFLLINRLCVVLRSQFEDVNDHSWMNKWFALLVAAVWLLHPLHISTVLYLVQRMTILSTLFSLLALFSYLVARRDEFGTAHSIRWQVLCWLVFFPLALFSKENAALLPLFILLVELCVFQRERLSHAKVGRIALAVSLLAVSVVFLRLDRILAGYARRDFSLWERLMTEGRVLVEYILMLVAPAQRRMGFFHDDTVVSTSLWQPWTTLPSIILLGALVFVAFRIRKTKPLVSLGILIFFAGHIIESTVIALELMFEHRNYLPSVGLLLAISAFMAQMIESKRFKVGLALALLMVLSALSYSRVDTWSSEESLDYYINMVHPKSERITEKLATKWSRFGLYEIAKKRLDSFDSLGANIHRAEIECLENKLLDASDLNFDWKRYRVADNYPVQKLVAIANLGLDGKCNFDDELFLSVLSEVMSITITPRSNRQLLLIYKAHYLHKQGLFDKAIDELNKAYALDKKNLLPLLLSCDWLVDLDLRDRAEQVCRTAFSKTKRHGNAQEEGALEFTRSKFIAKGWTP